eukprot:TRINITY_DN30737_c0_g1_i1.p1 TRINITY_DN30737_c0_g1~~TRINITY_DN30737_c0_g1_i1.p1  ORF type:complete len:295 (+),score=74.25 TRINITY_DN30737_c0_g1_i1:110-994(+)
MGNGFGGKQDQKWFEDEFLVPMGCAGPGSCCADTVGVEYKVLMVGLDGAGKTTLCLRLMGRGNEVPLRTGTEMAIYDNKMAKERCSHWLLPVAGSDGVTLRICDVGGRPIHRPLWGYMFRDVNAVLFVVDASDVERLQEAGNTLYEHVFPHLEAGQVPLIVLAHEKPGNEPLSEHEIMAGLGFNPTGLPTSPPLKPAPAPLHENEATAEALLACVAAALAPVYSVSAAMSDVEARRLRLMSRSQLLPPPDRFSFIRIPAEGGEDVMAKVVEELTSRIEDNVGRLTAAQQHERRS